MRPLIRYDESTNIPLLLKKLREDSRPLIVVAPTKAIQRLLIEKSNGDFVPIEKTDRVTFPLSVVLQNRFRASEATRDCRILSIDMKMLHSNISRFSREFRHSSSDRACLYRFLNPEKTWNIFRNLGIAREAFGNYDSWTERFTTGYRHRNGFYVVTGLKNLEALNEIVERYTRERR